MTTMTKTLLKNVVIFLAGAGAGAGITALILRAKYERIVQEELDSIHESFASRKRIGKNKGEDETDSDMERGYEEGVKKARIDYNKYSSLTRNYSNPPLEDPEQTAEEFAAEVEKRDLLLREWEGIYKRRPTHEVLYSEDDAEPWDEIFDNVVVFWYQMDDTFCEEMSNDVIENPGTTFGSEARGYLADTTAEEVVVRNNKIEILYTIYKVHDSYERAIKGIEPEDDDEEEEEEIDVGGESPKERMMRIARRKQREILKAKEMEDE